MPWRLYGDSEPEVIVCGHSHAYAFMRGAQHAPPSARFRRAVAYTSPVTAGAPTGDDYWDFVAQQRPASAFAVVWNGNQHNVDFLFEQTPPVHILRPTGTSDDPPADALWVSRSTLHAHFRPTIDDLRRVVDRLAATARVVIVGTPAPKPSLHVTAHVSGDAQFAAVIAASPPDRRPVVAREQLRLGLWEITQEMLRECAAAAAVEYLPAPDWSFDDSGLLRPELSASDSTHANLEYGSQVWDDLEQLIERRTAA